MSVFYKDHMDKYRSGSLGAAVAQDVQTLITGLGGLIPISSCPQCLNHGHDIELLIVVVGRGPAW